VTEAEWQAVLNTLTKNDFKNAYTKMAEALETLHPTSRVMVASRPKVSF
jgi:hypothetical protein